MARRNEADTPTYTNGGWTEAEDDEGTDWSDHGTEYLWDTMSQNPNPDGRPRRSSAGQRRKKMRKMFRGTSFDTEQQ